MDIETLRISSDSIFAKKSKKKMNDSAVFRIESLDAQEMEKEEEEEDPWKDEVRKEFGEDYMDDPYFTNEESFVIEYMRRREERGNETSVDDGVIFAGSSEGQSDGKMIFGDDDDKEVYLV